MTDTLMLVTTHATAVTVTVSRGLAWLLGMCAVGGAATMVLGLYWTAQDVRRAMRAEP
jgi:hypothetical protein